MGDKDRSSAAAPDEKEARCVFRLGTGPFLKTTRCRFGQQAAVQLSPKDKV